MASETPALSSTPTPDARNDFTGAVGFVFAPVADIVVTSVGMWRLAGNSQTHTVKFTYASGGADVPGGSASVDLAGQADGAYIYAPLAGPITLTAGTSYVIAMSIVAGGDYWTSVQTVTPVAAITMTAAAYSTGGAFAGVGGTNIAYGIPNFTIEEGDSTVQTLIPANAAAGPIRLAGVWEYGASWNLLQGMLSFDLADVSGKVELFVHGFTATPDPLYVTVDGVETAHTYPGDGVWLTIASGLATGRHSFEIVNQSAGVGYGFFGTADGSFLRVTRDPASPTPTMAAYSGAIVWPEAVDAPMAGPDRLASGDLYETSIGFATTAGATVEAFIPKSAASYTTRVAGVDSAVADLPSGNGFGWHPVATALSGALALVEITSPAPPPVPRIYALRSTPAGRIAAPAVRRPRLAFYGDSITAVQPNQYGYGWRLAKALGASALNLAMPTHNSTEILAKLLSTLDEMAAGVLRVPDVWSFLWGANDVSQAAATGVIGSNTTAAINAIRGAYPGAKVIFNGMVRGMTAASPGSDESDLPYNAAIKAACLAAGGVTYIDHRAAAPLAGYNSDGIHYTESGYDQFFAVALSSYAAALDVTTPVSLHRRSLFSRAGSRGVA